MRDALEGLDRRSALVVVAHPDDESFGLGAVLARLADGGTSIRVLCFTSGEASTLGSSPVLAAVRAVELACAAERLAVGGVTLLDHRDGGLERVPAPILEALVEDHLGDADLVVVFEPGGVTGHPDHRAATAAAEAVAARRGLAVLEWGVSADVADALNREFGTSFTALEGTDVDVDRGPQWRAIGCHASQALDNPVLHRRLELQGDHDRVRLT
jgi:LmbE family N-acetylglucosaminyl deacetylase